MLQPLLVFAVGNESRGDDALGPQLLRQLQAEAAGQAEFLEDFQWQVEHVTDLHGREAILFIDADVSCAAPFELAEISAGHDNSFSTHAMSPAALLHAYRQVYAAQAPRAFVLRIRGHGFELGSALSPEAEENLVAALQAARCWLIQGGHGAG
jgi:hydrogenase maturation protease